MKARVGALALTVSLLAGCGGDDQPAATGAGGVAAGGSSAGGSSAGGVGAGGKPSAGGAGDGGAAGAAEGGAGGAPPVAGSGGAGGVAGAGAGGAPAGVTLTDAELATVKTMSPLPALPADTTNKYADNADAAALGQMLFFEKRYSGALAVAADGMNGGLGMMMEAGKISCASCHAGGGLDDRRSQPGTVSLGADWLARNALPLVNASYYKWVNWAGRFDSQWSLPTAVAENAKNMNSDRLKVVHLLFDRYRSEYEKVFGALEPAIGSDPVRFPPSGKPKAAMAADGAWEMMADADRTIVNRAFANFGKALQAYLRTLVSKDSRFDAFAAGKMPLTSDETAGLKLFLGKAACVSCHSGPTFTDNAFHALGVPQTGAHVPAADLGRFTDVPPLLASPFNSNGAFSDDQTTGRLAGLTNPAPDAAKGQFRTPSLRGVAQTAPYMHAGQLPTLEAVVAYYDQGGTDPAMGMGVKDPALKPLGLTADEKAQLVAFLKTLTPAPVAPALLMDTSKK